MKIVNLTEPLLLDASVWVAASVPTNSSSAVAGAVARSDRSIAVLDLTLYEVANALGKQYGQPEQAKRLVQVILRTCGDVSRVDETLAGDLVDIAEEHDLTAYDAAYVAAARRHGWQLVSLDIRDLVSKGLAVTPDAAVYP